LAKYIRNGVLLTLDGATDGVEGGEVGEGGTGGSQEVGHLVVVVVFKLDAVRKGGSATAERRLLRA